MAQLMMDVTTPQNNGIAGASYQQPSTVSGEAAPPTRVLGRVLSLTPPGSAPTEEALLVDFQEIFSLSFEQERADKADSEAVAKEMQSILALTDAIASMKQV